MPSGLLLVDKPEGTRSTDCVNRVRSALRPFFPDEKIRAGHAGTLDSTASGLLVLLIGSATRLSDYIMALPKIYYATLCFGQATDTCDYSGQVVFQSETGSAGLAGVTDGDIDRVLPAFYGWRMQRPPVISAVKLNGQPLHRLARSGHEVEPEPRPVFFRSVRRVSPVQNGQAAFEVRCGKGTYIRSFARDLGDRLGCGAFIRSLRRVSVGGFHVNGAIPLDDLLRLLSRDNRNKQDAQNKNKIPLRSPEEAVGFFNHIELTEEAERDFFYGRSVPLAEAGRFVPGTEPVDLKGELCVRGKAMLGFAGRYLDADRGKIFLRPKVNVLSGPCPVLKELKELKEGLP